MDEAILGLDAEDAREARARWSSSEGPVPFPITSASLGANQSSSSSLVIESGTEPYCHSSGKGQEVAPVEDEE